MNSDLTNPTQGRPNSLYQLVGEVLCDSQQAANHNRTVVINEVGSSIHAGEAMDRAAPVIADIIRTVIGNSRNGEIHISADQYQDIVIVEIQERNNYNGYALAFSLGSIEPQAVSIGGHLTIRGQQQKITTICFSFPRTSIAA